MGVSLFGIPLLAWSGTLLLLVGEIVALLHLRNLSRLLLFSTLAELGYVLLGLGLNNASGETGALLHLGLQAIMRLLTLTSAAYLIKRNGSSELSVLAGSGSRMPLASLLFGFGLFSVMGLSPFKGSFSKFLILYGAMEQGEWAIAAVATVATILASVYYIIVIQRVCLERDENVILAPFHFATLLSPRWLIMLLLTAITIAVSIAPEPLLHLAEHYATPSITAAVPNFETPWHYWVIVPYVGGFLLYGVGVINSRLRDRAAVVIALATLYGVWQMDASDSLSHLFSVLFAGLIAVVVIYSQGYMRNDKHANRYYFFLFLMAGSLIGVTTAGDFGNFYLFWELMTWSSYFLVVHERTSQALKAGRKYFLMCCTGAYIMHFGILVCHTQFGSFDMALIASQAAQLTPGFATVIGLCFLIGLGVKAGLYPLHGWLPDAHPVAPSSISALMSGVLTKAGVYGLAKIMLVVLGTSLTGQWLTAGALPAFGLALSLLGCLTVIYGEVKALREQNLKRILAFSTLAQVGEILAMLGLLTSLSVAGALFHVINHAIFKNLLFLAAGGLIARAAGKHLSDLAGLGRVMPFTALCFAIGALAVMGLPPFSGFYSKFLMIYAAVHANAVTVALLFLTGSVLGAIYYLRIVRVLFFARYQGTGVVEEAPLAMRVATGLLAALVVLGGVFPDYGLQHWIQPAIAQIAYHQGWPVTPLPTLNLEWSPATAIAIIGALLTFLLGKRAPRRAGMLAVGVMALTLGAVLLDAGRYDLLSYWFAVLIAGVGLLNLCYAIGYMAHGHSQHRFFFFFIFMIGGLLGITASKDLFNFFAFWEIMSSWTLYFVIIHDETEEALQEGFKYFIFNFVGATCMFLGVAILCARSDAFSFDAILAAAQHMPLPWLGAGLFLLLSGLLMKSAQLPWRIDYQMHPPTAPTPVSGYISAVLLKSGIYGVLKLFALGGAGMLFVRFGSLGDTSGVMYSIALIATVTLLYAGAMALIQNGIKRLLIYSTVSQLGYILLGLALATPEGIAGGLMHLVNHLLLKDILFLAAGCILAQVHVVSLDQLSGLGRKMPITFALFLFAGLSLSGIPPLNGFASKWLIYQAAFQSGHYLLALSAMMSSLFTLAAVLKFAHAAFMGQPAAHLENVTEAPRSMLLPMGVLSAAALVISLLPGVLLVPISHLMAQAGLGQITASWGGALPGLHGWHPLTLWVLVAMVAGCGGVFYRLSNRQSQHIHLHQGGVTDITPAQAHVPASALYQAPERFIRLALHAQNKD
ncbi:proton-conducting transporter membrane subunit [Candidatus Symbiopectobacterium sp. NZEC151]|uniref:proton-conducting transporter transmembrane domain-containing protein n=2 Tax=unclassified Symbiopectobacterium TaxID=2794573 RepID=UPI002227BF77|nr:proton-conducting transporter membrane subunit [Candidatus Symbiopectobacterium sp. NZEC151]MCW2473956.1 oxidoreductase [Candidatus Symbiopectobacterium sp. NZEC151]